jgi:hypothetical protein
MEFKLVKENIDGLKWMKDNLGISETEENELKELELLLEQREKMLNELIDLVWLIERGATNEELQERIVQSKRIIKESTEL